MNKDRLKKFADCLSLEIAAKQPRTNWITIHCPFAKWRHSNPFDTNPSFGLSVKENGESRYHCFSCNSSGDLMDLILELKALNFIVDFKGAVSLANAELDAVDLDIPDYESEIETSKIIAWSEEYLNSFIPAIKSKPAMKYLQSRNVPYEVVTDLDLRYDTSRKRVCFPIRTWKGKLVGLHGRDITGESELTYLAYKYQNVWNRPVWYGEHLVDPDQPVVLVESVFDLASVYRVYRNVLCSLTCGLSYDKLQRISALTEVYTMYDYGKGGDRARVSLSELYKGGIITHLIPTKQQKDPGAMSPSAIVRLLQEYIELDSLIS